MKYIYLGDKLTDPCLIGKKCAAVLNSKGKCIRSRLSTMLVDFGSEKHIVLARRLRKIKFILIFFIIISLSCRNNKIIEFYINGEPCYTQKKCI